jgi:hypothetical protein
MAFDPKAGYVLLFGGESFSPSFLRDSWKFR